VKDSATAAAIVVVGAAMLFHKYGPLHFMIFPHNLAKL